MYIISISPFSKNGTGVVAHEVSQEMVSQEMVSPFKVSHSFVEDRGFGHRDFTGVVTQSIGFGSSS
jgi:hypothetical protein